MNLAINIETIAAIDVLVDDVVSQCCTPAIIVAVVDNGRVVHDASRGIAGGTKPVTSSTRFRIASMTKSFTATTVLALRDEGLLALDDPIALHVPQLLSVQAPTADSSPITIRQLLTMSAGLVTDDDWADRHLGDTHEEMDDLFGGGATFANSPGIGLDYSNYGYAMLGRIIEAVTGLSSTQVISERVLAPLGLDATTFDVPGSFALPHRVVDRHAVAEGSEPLANGGFAPMGGLWSTVEDLARWIGFLSDAFPPRDDADPFAHVLCRSSRREMQQVHRSSTPPVFRHRPDGTVRQVLQGYGMGLTRSHHFDVGAVIAHSGGLPGYGSHMRWILGSSIGVVALANVTYAPMSKLSLDLIDALIDTGAVSAPIAEFDSSLVLPAGEALATLFTAWDDDLAYRLFADNVFPDEPIEQRRRAVADLVDQVGPLALGSVLAISRAEGRVTLEGKRGTVTVAFRLGPMVPSAIQWYHAEMSAE